MRDRSPPPIEVRNRQRTISISARELQQFANIACSLAWKFKTRQSEIGSINQIFVLIVSDRRMAMLHKKFCGIPGPTDVLAFQHGEIAISADMAARQARTFGSKLNAEIQLYILHGLLHLAGFDDMTPAKRRRMQRLQKKLFGAILRTGL